MPDGNQHKGEVSATLRLIDVINHFEFPDGDSMFRPVVAIAFRLARRGSS